MSIKSYHVIIADDDDDDQFIIKEAISEFHDRQIHITTVYDGLQLLDYLNKKGSIGASFRQPDLILLDINMPIVNGIEALQSIRSEESLKQIPVCIITTGRSDEHRAQCEQLGAQGFYIKPNRIGAYRAILEDIFNKITYEFTK